MSAEKSISRAALAVKTARFWKRVSKPDNGCWEWTAGRYPHGYGRLTWNATSSYAHRVAWELTYGPIPKGMCVCHHCDNPPCVRLDHLFLGTMADNMRDRDIKGRDRHRTPEARAKAAASRRARRLTGML